MKNIQSDGPTEIRGKQVNSRTLTLDIEKYERYLEDEDLTDEQKKQLLESLWSVVCQFVLLGFQIHPVQQANSSGKDKIATPKAPFMKARKVESVSKQLATKFLSVTDSGKELAQEGAIGD